MIFRSAACHGADGKTLSMGKSKAIAGWSVEQTMTALNGYKDGSYGGALKAVMKGQVSPMSETQMKAVAEYISKL